MVPSGSPKSLGFGCGVCAWGHGATDSKTVSSGRSISTWNGIEKLNFRGRTKPFTAPGLLYPNYKVVGSGVVLKTDERWDVLSSLG